MARLPRRKNEAACRPLLLVGSDSSVGEHQLPTFAPTKLPIYRAEENAGGRIPVTELARSFEEAPRNEERLFDDTGHELQTQLRRCRSYLLLRPLKELARSKPSDVMSRYSTSVKNFGSTHVALGFLIG